MFCLFSSSFLIFLFPDSAISPPRYPQVVHRTLNLVTRLGPQTESVTLRPQAHVRLRVVRTVSLTSGSDTSFQQVTVKPLPFSSFVAWKQFASDTEQCTLHILRKPGSEALLITWPVLKAGATERSGYGWQSVMDPEQLIGQLTELRTQNQQLHQALQQVQQQQAQQRGLVQALAELPQTRAQTVGAAVVAATSRAKANLGGHERPWPATAAEKHGE